jgi:hypothetical protein
MSALTIVSFAIIVEVTVPVSPDVISVPVVAGIVIAVVPAVAAGVTVIVPDVEPGIAIDVMPVNPKLADPRFNAIEVVPTNNDELPNTPEGIVPDKLPAVKLVKFVLDTAPNDADQVPLVTVPTVVAAAALTAAVVTTSVLTFASVFGLIAPSLPVST